MKRTERILYYLIVAAVLLVAISLLFFISFFGGQKFSEDISDWAYFGNYVGGVVGTITAIFSFIVLAIITIWVSKQGNEESKNLFLTKKKMDAYEELTSKIHLFVKGNDMTELIRALNSFNEAPFIKIDAQGNMELDRTSELAKESKRVFFNANEFYLFIFHFRLRFSHVFSYDFDSNEHRSLIAFVQAYRDKLKLIYERYNYNEHFGDSKKYNFIEEFNSLSDSLSQFSTKLRTELM
ncbi:hypothetical protein INQ51_04570 [Maribellus sp. CM-23]|uniref:hypothetical protein n=1 Tax=Maribellus sp. CM-23 TaxID=2781026 RepID=UPI001F2D2551|nr:hypothetical protein [Maribellus sp. CM-23]MCE4563574.1 hypothetical protein [Maribellus sp. CM-23]